MMQPQAPRPGVHGAVSQRMASSLVHDAAPFRQAQTAHVMAGHQAGLTTTSQKILQGGFTNRGLAEQVGKVVGGKTLADTGF